MASTVPHDPPKFPTLDAGLTVLRGDGRVTGALQSLVLDHLLLNDGTAVWVDSKNNAATTSLAKIAPSRRVLDRVRVGRAFTAFQHYSLIEDVPAAVSDETSLLVAPAIDWFYTADDLRSSEGEEMLEAALDRLESVVSNHELTVLLSSAGEADVMPMVAGRADTTIECVRTGFGPRFTGDGFETLVFECDGGIQTTFAYWRRVLAKRHPSAAANPPEGVPGLGTH